MCDRGSPGNAGPPAEYRKGNHRVIEMGHAAMIGVIGDEQVAIMDAVIPVQLDDALYRLVENADKGGNSGT